MATTGSKKGGNVARSAASDGAAGAGQADGAIAGGPLAGLSLTLGDNPLPAGARNTSASWKTAASGTWGVKTNWSTGAVPDAATDVTIGVAGKYTVTIAAASVAASLTVSDASATIADNSTLTIGTTLGLGTGTFTLGSGAVLSGGTVVVNGGSFVNAGGTLNGLTYDGVLNLSGSYASATLTGNDSFAGANGTGQGTINVTGQNDVLYINDSSTLTGATLNLGNASGYEDQINVYNTQSGTSETLTLGTSVVLQAATGYNFLNEYVQSGNSTIAILNKGTIAASNSATLNIADNGYGYGSFTNQGLMTATTGGTLDIAPTSFTNAGSILASGSYGTTLTIDSATLVNTGTINVVGVNGNSGMGDVYAFIGGAQTGTWTNQGVITVSKQGDVILGGTFSLATLNSVTNNGGYLDIGGTLLNSGTLTVPGLTGGIDTLYLDGGGTIMGGTISDPNGQLNAGGTLSGVTYDGVLNLTDPSASATLTGNDSFAGANGTGQGTINVIGPNDVLYINDSSTLTGATLNLGNASGYEDQINVYNTQSGTSETLTLGTSVVLQAATGYNFLNEYVQSGNSTIAILNKGTIAASNSATLNIADNGDGSFTNQGLMTATTGGTLDIAPTSFTNAGSILASGSYGTTLTIDSATLVNTGTMNVVGVNGNSGMGDVYAFIGGAQTGTWTNQGVITVSKQGDVILGGTFSLATLNSVTNNGGYLDIGGTLLNSGTLSVPGLTGGIDTLYLDGGGTIMGGTVSDPNGQLNAAGTLSGVTYDGVLNLTGPSASATLTGNDSFAGANGTGQGTINVIGPNDVLYINDSSTLTGATLNLGNASGYEDQINVYNTQSGTSETLTLGTSVVLQAATGYNFLNEYVQSGNSTIAILNKGTIAASNSATLNIADNGYGSFTNQGLMTATTGGTLDIAPTSFTNAGSISVGAANFLLQPTNFTNLHANTLTGGSYEVDAGGTLQLASNLTVVTDNATIILSGAGSVFESLNTGSNHQVTLDQKLTSIGTLGALELLIGRNFTASAAFTDAGSLQIGGSTFTSANGLSITTAGSLFGNGKVAAAVANAGKIEARGGNLLLSAAITGTGALQVDANATLELGAAVASTQTVSFSGQGGTLKLDAPLNFSGVVGGFGAGDTLDLAGVSATSAAANGATLAVTLGNGGTLNFNLTSAVPGERFGTFSDGNGGTDVTAFRYAAGTVAPASVSLGNVHVGAVDSAGVALTNTAAADGYSEKLDAAFAGAAAGVMTAGTVTALAAGATDASDLSVGINTAAAGTISGSATLALSTDGAGADGGAALSIGSQIIAVSGAVFAYAAGTLAASNVAFGNHHVGDTVRQALTLTNAGPATGGYTERLDATLSGAQGGLSVAGGITQLTQGQTDATSLTLGLSTASAGAISGSATLALASDGGGIDTLGTTALAPISVAGSGGVFAYAAAQVAGGTIDLGIHHVGDTVSRALTLTNAGPSTGGYTEALDAMLGGGTGGVTASGALSGLGAGASDTSSLLLGLLTGSAGVKTGTATLTAQSDGAGIDGLGTTALGNQTINVTGTIDNYATLGIEQINGKKITTIANGGTIDLGAVAMGAKGPSVKLGILNGATGPADVLGGSFATSGKGYTLKGFSAFSGLTAGKDEEGQTVTLKTTAAGTFSETITVNGTGSNASGYSGGLAAETITITGTVTTGHTPAFLAAAGVAAAAAVGDGVDTGWGAFNAPAGIAANGPPAVGAVPLGWALAGGAYDVLHVAPLHEAPVR